MTEFMYGDEVWWLSSKWKAKGVPAVVVDERRWGGVSAGTGGVFPPEIADYPVFIRVADESEPRWVSGRELSLIRPREDF